MIQKAFPIEHSEAVKHSQVINGIIVLYMYIYIYIYIYMYLYVYLYIYVWYIYIYIYIYIYLPIYIFIYMPIYRRIHTQRSASVFIYVWTLYMNFVFLHHRHIEMYFIKKTFSQNIYASIFQKPFLEYIICINKSCRNYI